MALLEGKHRSREFRAYMYVKRISWVITVGQFCLCENVCKAFTAYTASVGIWRLHRLMIISAVGRAMKLGQVGLKLFCEFHFENFVLIGFITVKYALHLDCFISCSTTYQNAMVLGWIEKARQRMKT